MRDGTPMTVGIALLNGGMAAVMYYAGFEAVAVVWIGLAAVVLMGAYWDRSTS
jgi:hypothetical protein